MLSTSLSVAKLSSSPANMTTSFGGSWSSWNESLVSISAKLSSMEVSRSSGGGTSILICMETENGVEYKKKWNRERKRKEFGRFSETTVFRNDSNQHKINGKAALAITKKSMGFKTRSTRPRERTERNHHEMTQERVQIPSDNEEPLMEGYMFWWKRLEGKRDKIRRLKEEFPICWWERERIVFAVAIQIYIVQLARGRGYWLMKRRYESRGFKSEIIGNTEDPSEGSILENRIWQRDLEMENTRFWRKHRKSAL